MRQVYLTLLLIGCITFISAQNAQSPLTIPATAAAQNCTSETSVTGCTTCKKTGTETVTYTCDKAADGYYVNATTSQASVCPRACTKCSAAGNVITCSACVNYPGWTDTTCTACSAGYTLDSTISLVGVCIPTGALGNYSCQTGYFWDRTPQTTRKCVASQSSCATNYATNAAGNITTNISANCDYCIPTYSILADVSSATVANPNINYVCQAITPVPTRNQAVQCSGGLASTASCKTCNAATNKCQEANPGYFIQPTGRRLRGLDNAVEGDLSSCPVQCSSCDNATACTACDATYSTLNANTKNCDCTNGYTASFPVTAFDPNVVCIKRSLNQQCGTSNGVTYVWNSPVQIDSTTATAASVSACVNPVNSSCAVDPKANATNNLTSVWDRATGKSRTCTLAIQKICAQTFAQNQNDPSNVYASALTTNCNYCVQDFSLQSQNGDSNENVCVKNFSGIMTISTFLFGILLVLIF